MLYELTDKMKERIDNAFTYHPVITDQQHRYVALRELAKELAIEIARYTPPGREQSLALTALEETIMWANAAIARNEV